MEDMQLQTVNITRIKPYEKNPRRNDQAVDAVAESIRQCGYCAPIVVDETFTILAGHTRYKALKRLGWQEVQVCVKEGLTEQQKHKYRILDNKTNELAEWDEALLQEELQGLDFEGYDFGFTVAAVTDPTEVREDTPPEPPENPQAQRGQIWRLGNHRLMCGDSTSREDVQALMDGASADLLLTDPPYNVDVGNCDRPGTSANANVHILNDSMETEAFTAFLTSALKNADERMRQGAAYYIFYAGLHHIEFENAVRRVQDFKLHEQLVWVKDHFVLGRNSDYQWMHEPILYGWKGGGRHYFTDSRAQSTVIEDQAVKLSTMRKNELITLCERLMGMTKSTTVLRDTNQNIAGIPHPTVKPQHLLAELICNSSQPGWKVLDLFGGSGSTLIACEQLGRECFTMELDPHYCDVIIQRWEDFTGGKAELVERG